MPASDLIQDMIDTLSTSTAFLDRLNGVAAEGRIYILRNEEDLSPKQVMERPFIIVDIPNISWIQSQGEQCFVKSFLIQIDIWDESDTRKATDDSKRYIDYVESIIDHVLENSNIRFNGVTEKVRPNTPTTEQKTADDVNNLWMSSYAFQSSSV